MEDFIDEQVGVMVDSDTKPWMATLKSHSPRGVVVSVTSRTTSNREEFKGLVSETDVDIFIPWFRLRFLAHGEFKGIS